MLERVRVLFHHCTQNLLVLGEGGTGKSQLLRELIKEYKLRHPRSWSLAVCAPTGRAAHLISGFTLHKFFHLPHTLQLPSAQALPVSSDYTHLRTLIIDEISMVRADVLDVVERKLRAGGPEPGKPFGGVRLVLMGDVLQLPPVVKPNDLPYFSGQAGPKWESPWFFSAKSFSLGDFTKVTLTENFRHKADPAFGDTLSRARVARFMEARPSDIAHFNMRQGQPEPQDSVIITPTNAVANRYGAEKFAAIQRQVRVYRASENNWPHDEDPPVAWTIRLKPEARVMVCANLKNGLYNGALGTVTRCCADSVWIKPDDPTRSETEIQRHPWTRQRYRWNAQTRQTETLPEERFSQIPLKLAWAFTIYKMQGQTVEGPVLVDMNWVWEGGMGYVALSRARRLEQLHLKHRITHDMLYANEKALQFHHQADTPMTEEERQASEAVLARYAATLNEIRSTAQQIENAVQDARDEWKAQRTALQNLHSEFMAQLQATKNAMAAQAAECSAAGAQAAIATTNAQATKNQLNATLTTCSNAVHALQNAITHAQAQPWWKRLLG